MEMTTLDRRYEWRTGRIEEDTCYKKKGTDDNVDNRRLQKRKKRDSNADDRIKNQREERK